MILTANKKKLLQYIGQNFCPILAVSLQQINQYEQFLLQKTITINLRQTNGQQTAKAYQKLIQDLRSLTKNDTPS